MTILGIALLLVLWCGAGALLLTHAGEYMPLEAVIKKQEGSKIIYGPLHPDVAAYKEYLYQARTPAVVVLGSGRVLPLRQEDFSRPFTNLGGLESLDDVDTLARSAFADHAPPLVLLGIDFWWFHPDSKQMQHHPHWTAADLFRPVWWLIQGKKFFEGDNIGLAAKAFGDGYNPDGSYHDASLLAHGDKGFGQALVDIAKGRWVYAPANQVLEARLVQFEDLLVFLQEHGATVILFLPPLAPSVEDALAKAGTYTYVSDLRQKLRAGADRSHTAFFDFHDAAGFGATDCEFQDGSSGGAVVYQRMLLNMAIENEEMRASVRLPEIGWNIRHYAGHALLQKDEPDFLGLGCEKKNP